MLLIVAALEEELRTGMALCRDLNKIRGESAGLWQGVRNEKTICFLKAGVGPRRSAANLEEALGAIQPERIFIVGYAGAIDPGLKLGSLVAVRKALAFSLDRNRPDWEFVQLDGVYELGDSEVLADCAKRAGLDAIAGDAMTSAHVLGNPQHKHLLHEKFHASIVDMETAALARIAISREIPVSCVRAISDEASDSFLEPFSYDPSAKMSARAGRLMHNGLGRTYRAWRDHAAVAQKSLRRFLAHCL